MLVDYAEIVARLLQALGRHYAASPSILNVPGVSAALKIDPFYYLALRPLFGELLGKWAGVAPSRAEETLLRTGNMVSGPGLGRYPRPVVAFEEDVGVPLRLAADFVTASFIDRAVTMYGGASGPLPVSGLRLARDQKDDLEAFFQGTTPIASLAYGEVSAP